MDKKISISISNELDTALAVVGTKLDLNKSKTIETLLRENEYIQSAINSIRMEEKMESPLFAFPASNRHTNTDDITKDIVNYIIPKMKNGNYNFNPGKEEIKHIIEETANYIIPKIDNHKYALNIDAFKSDKSGELKMVKELIDYTINYIIIPNSGKIKKGLHIELKSLSKTDNKDKNGNRVNIELNEIEDIMEIIKLQIKLWGILLNNENRSKRLNSIPVQHALEKMPEIYKKMKQQAKKLDQTVEAV